MGGAAVNGMPVDGKASDHDTGAEYQDTMTLAMKSECERCAAELMADGKAYICSQECTFCVPCAQTLHHICPNCESELVRRPRRAAGSR
jgi:hypothetical protein